MENNKRFRIFESPNGCMILIGKNDVSNNLLTFNVAEPDDIWLHVSGLPGPHVVLRQNSKMNNDDLRFAASLAFQYSKAAKLRNHGTVDYCNAKHVSKTNTVGLVKLSLENTQSIIINI